MMMSRIFQIGFLLACVFVPILSVDLTMILSAPTPIRVGTTEQISVHCRFEGQARDIPLKFLKLQSKKETGEEKFLAQISSPGASPVIQDPSLQNRAEVAGSLYDDASSSSYLRLTISNISCVDATTYKCLSEYQNASGLVSLYEETVVEGVSDPSELELVLDPPKMNTDYEIGTTVTIKCSGKIGKPAKEWNWFKHDNDTSLWEPLNQNINQEELIQVSDCAFRRDSTYTFRIPDEHEHRFRCTAGDDVDDSLYVSINPQVSGADSIITSALLLVASFLYIMAVL